MPSTNTALKEIRHVRKLVEAKRGRVIPEDPVEFMVKLVGISPDPWQERVLKYAARPGQQTVLACGRQVGKSTVASTLALHTALIEPGSLVLIVAPSLRQAVETFGNCARVYRSIGEPVPFDSHRKLGLSLKNGSRIEALPGTPKTIRGFASVRLLIIDEAAQVDQELYTTVRPMLAVSGGSLLLASTPYGMIGPFPDAFFHGGEAWHRESIPSTECPRISLEFLETERASMPDQIFRREYLCSFEDSDTQVFSEELIQSIANDDLVPVDL